MIGKKTENFTTPENRIKEHIDKRVKVTDRA
jgi:hypothetical protein